MPEVIVAIMGVLDFSLMLAKNLKSSPSSAMAHITRGIGNMEPNRLVQGRETDSSHAMQLACAFNIY